MKRPKDSSGNSHDEQRPSVPAVAELASPPGSSQVFPAFLRLLEILALSLEYRNAERELQNKLQILFIW